MAPVPILNSSTGTLNSHASIVNDSSVISYGTVKLFKTSTFTNNRTFENRNLLKNYGSLTNNLILNTYVSSTTENYNSLINNTSGYIRCSSIFINKKVNATNSDSVDLTGITGTITNNGSLFHQVNTFTNNGTITVY